MSSTSNGLRTKNIRPLYHLSRLQAHSPECFPFSFFFQYLLILGPSVLEIPSVPYVGKLRLRSLSAPSSHPPDGVWSHSQFKSVVFIQLRRVNTSSVDAKWCSVRLPYNFLSVSSTVVWMTHNEIHQRSGHSMSSEKRIRPWHTITV